MIEKKEPAFGLDGLKKAEESVTNINTDESSCQYFKGETHFQNVISFAEKGIPVYPVKQKGEVLSACYKDPASHATTDIEKIKSWHYKDKHNIFYAYIWGLYCFVDFDNKNGKTGSQFLNKFNQNTFHNKTKTNGDHLLYKINEQIKEGDFANMPGVELKGRFFPIHGAFISNGGIYRNIKNIEPAEFDYSLLDLLEKKESYSKNNGKITKGSRNQFLYRKLCAMRSHGDDDDTIEKNAALINLQELNPPLAMDEVQSVIESVCKFETGKIEIWAGNQNTPELSEQCYNALNRSNSPEYLFSRHGKPVRMLKDGNIQSITQDILKFEIERAATFFHYSTNKNAPGEKLPAKAPSSVLPDMMSYDPIPFPGLTKISNAPCFDKKLNLCSSVGYHPSGIYLKTGTSPISELPTLADAFDLINDLFYDFPFATDADRTNAISLVLTLFCRDIIHGNIPLFVIEAPTPGTGKGLLVYVCTEIGCGGELSTMTPTEDQDELRKQITSLLLSAVPAVNIDNAENLSGSVLSSSLTSNPWSDRRLGANEQISIPNNTVWIATGNNITFSTEMVRRSVRIRLQPDTDRPWQKSNFRHPRLLQYVKENRSKLQAAFIVIIKSWIDAGRPKGEGVAFGSFEEFSEVMSGMLTNAGIPSFLENRLEMFEESDNDGAAWRELVFAWWEQFSNQRVGVNELFQLAIDTEGIDLPQKNEKAQKIAFGIQLNKYRDRIYDKYRIVSAGKSKRLKMYKLQKVGDE